MKIPIQKEPTTITPPKSDSAYCSSLVLQNGELKKALELSSAMLCNIARGYGFGDEYNKIKQLMGRVQSIYDESTRTIETGEMWRNGEIIL